MSDEVILSNTTIEPQQQKIQWDRLNYEFFANFQSSHTRISYENDIKQFFHYVEKSHKEINSLDQIDRLIVISFRNWLNENDFAPKSINRKLSSISSYFDFLIEKNLMKINPAGNIRRPRQEVVTPTNDLSDEQIVSLFQAISEDKVSAPLHRAILYVLFTTGIRKSELINLKRGDFKQTGEHYTIHIYAKGGKFLTKIIHPTTVDVIKEYLGWMHAKGRTVADEDYLFMPTKNPHTKGMLTKSLTPKAIDYIIKKYCQEANITERITPHSARASYIGSALEAGVDLWRVARDVGHSSVKTTEIYNKRKQSFEDSPVYALRYLQKKAS